MKLIDNIMREIDTITNDKLEEVAKGLKPIDFGMKVVGAVVPLELQKLWVFLESLAVSLREETDRVQAVVKNDPEINEQEYKEVTAISEVISYKMHQAKDFFWLAVRAELEVDAKEIGLRADWQIVELYPVCSGCGARHEGAVDNEELSLINSLYPFL